MNMYMHTYTHAYSSQIGVISKFIYSTGTEIASYGFIEQM